MLRGRGGDPSLLLSVRDPTTHQVHAGKFGHKTAQAFNPPIFIPARGFFAESDVETRYCEVLRGIARDSRQPVVIGAGVAFGVGGGYTRALGDRAPPPPPPVVSG